MEPSKGEGDTLADTREFIPAVFIFSLYAHVVRSALAPFAVPKSVPAVCTLILVTLLLRF